MANIMDLVRQKKQALQAQSGRREATHKVQPGKNRYRILPGWRGAGDPTFFHDFGQHFVKDLKGDLKAVYVCTEKTFGKPCAICDAVSQGMQEASDDDVINALKESKSKGRVLMNALHLDGEDPNTPIILDLTPTTFEKVLELMEEYGDITDLNEGVDVIITRSGKGLNTEYSVMPAPKSSPVDASVLKNLHNLDEYVKQEYDEGRNKALAVVSSVSGLLPAAASAADIPSTPAPSSVLDDAEEADYEPVSAAVGDDSTASAASGSDDDAMSDDELDALLGEL